ncbi:MAG: 4-alpha-glucanotransferase [Pseudomonas sp.]
MSDLLLADLARAAGLAVDWIDANGRSQRVTPQVLHNVLQALGYPCATAAQIADSLQQATGQQPLPPLLTADQAQPLPLNAYFQAHTPYRIILEDGSHLDGQLDSAARLPGINAIGYQQLQIAEQSLTLAVAPAHCFSMQDLVGHAQPRTWGLTAQVYALRRAGDGGMGDTLALEQLVRAAAERGADAVAISPLHAMFSADPQRFSPYSPSSRLFLNVLHSAPTTVLGAAAVQAAIDRTGLAPELQRLEHLHLLDWPEAIEAKQWLLHALCEDFFSPSTAASAALQQDFQTFRQAGGEALENHCRFEALYAEQALEGGPHGWQSWPEALRDPNGAAVDRFAAEHQPDIRFHCFAQWLIARCLQHTQHAARAAGMGIGLIADLAVGADGGGSQAWSRQDELLATLSVGAPPDILNRTGQGWGVSAFSPQGLRRNGFRAFIEMLRANFAYAGGVRIDHVMGLSRLWLIPAGAQPHEGAYLHYPEVDLLRLLALESWRHRALVLGEDLGTVPEGFNHLLEARRILGTRVLLFEQSPDGPFKPAHTWCDTAMATTTTHDLPTMAGWWRGRDLDWQLQLGMLIEANQQQFLQERACNREYLTQALAADAQPDAPPMVQPGVQTDAQTTAKAEPHSARPTALTPSAMVDGCIAFIGHTPAPLVLVPMEDVLGLEEQANVPGSSANHPNWRRRWPGESAKLLDGETAERRVNLVKQARAQASQHIKHLNETVSRDAHDPTQSHP